MSSTERKSSAAMCFELSIMATRAPSRELRRPASSIARVVSSAAGSTIRTSASISFVLLLASVHGRDIRLFDDFRPFPHLGAVEARELFRRAGIHGDALLRHHRPEIVGARDPADFSI